MKRSLFVLLTLTLIFFMASCGETEKVQQPAEYEVAMIAGNSRIEDGSFAESIWESVNNFSGSNGLTAKRYMPEEPTKEAYMASVEEAVADSAKIIILAGSSFETTVYDAQSKYPDIYFLLIDGVPHDSEDKYAASSNTIGVIFAEEQAGYMAGYAAVMDGYDSLGFMGAKASPSVKRYGAGFVQGAASAAQELEKKVEIAYKYMDTAAPSKEVKQEADSWYEEGVEVIFACGGEIDIAVADSAEAQNGKMIGADTDQSGLSKTVITSAQKEINVVVTDMLENYVDGKFVGGTAFNYTAQNGGVSLQMDNAKFTGFNNKDYEKLFNKLKNNKIEVKKDVGVDSVRELTGEWVTIK